eukprot:TRINITY_DN953_c0_g2_i3.p1 TRINITY_DN953_c0_g2~~TRINITY_DN953_c0_g2_i3.p1  ORF type:complete len:351 (+),score=106.20 TRINITY_DN953_c0_g2_i3:144-1196(+)
MRVSATNLFWLVVLFICFLILEVAAGGNNSELVDLEALDYLIHPKSGDVAAQVDKILHDQIWEHFPLSSKDRRSLCSACLRRSGLLECSTHAVCQSTSLAKGNRSSTKQKNGRVQIRINLFVDSNNEGIKKLAKEIKRRNLGVVKVIERLGQLKPGTNETSQNPEEEKKIRKQKKKEEKQLKKAEKEIKKAQKAEKKRAKKAAKAERKRQKEVAKGLKSKGNSAPASFLELVKPDPKVINRRRRRSRREDDEDKHDAKDSDDELSEEEKEKFEREGYPSGPNEAIDAPFAIDEGREGANIGLDTYDDTFYYMSHVLGIEDPDALAFFEEDNPLKLHEDDAQEEEDSSEVD